MKAKEHTQIIRIVARLAFDLPSVWTLLCVRCGVVLDGCMLLAWALAMRCICCATEIQHQIPEYVAWLACLDRLARLRAMPQSLAR